MQCVRDLKVGDHFEMRDTGCEVVVRGILANSVRVSKPSAYGMHGLMSVPFSTHEFDDLINRVKVFKP